MSQSEVVFFRVHALAPECLKALSTFNMYLTSWRREGRDVTAWYAVTDREEQDISLLTIVPRVQTTLLYVLLAVLKLITPISNTVTESS